MFLLRIFVKFVALWKMLVQKSKKVFTDVIVCTPLGDGGVGVEPFFRRFV